MGNRRNKIDNKSIEDFEKMLAKIEQQDRKNKLLENENLEKKNKKVKTEEQKQQEKQKQLERKQANKKRREEAEERIKLIREKRRAQFLQCVKVDLSQENNYYNEVVKRIKNNGNIPNKGDNYAINVVAQNAVQERQRRMFETIRNQKQNIEQEL